GVGVAINASSNNTIGGTAAGAGNTIAFNLLGVDVTSGSGDSVLSNSIFANAALGIDLGPSGVTLNDPNDLDAGANNLQNFPVIATVSSMSSSVTIHGLLNSAPSTTYLLQFFANPSAHPSGFGEGKTLLGSASVTTNA